MPHGAPPGARRRRRWWKQRPRARWRGGGSGGRRLVRARRAQGRIEASISRWRFISGRSALFTTSTPSHRHDRHCESIAHRTGLHGTFSGKAHVPTPPASAPPPLRASFRAPSAAPSAVREETRHRRRVSLGASLVGDHPWWPGDPVVSSMAPPLLSPPRWRRPSTARVRLAPGRYSGRA